MEFIVVIINTLVFMLLSKYSFDAKQGMLLSASLTFLCINIFIFIDMFVLGNTQDNLDNYEIEI